MYLNSRSRSIYLVWPTTAKCRIRVIVFCLVQQYQLSSSCCVVIELMRFFLQQEEAPVHARVRGSPPGLFPEIVKPWPVSWSS